MSLTGRSIRWVGVLRSVRRVSSAKSGTAGSDIEERIARRLLFRVERQDSLLKHSALLSVIEGAGHGQTLLRRCTWSGVDAETIARAREEALWVGRRG